ncbi:MULTISPECIES: hypothetical protein [Spirosoma]|uniref:Uncharacterized protein n=1 Tax=Spirosoma liriopis TaxID=2937440 RepID=A0ABT0HU91_9BACT|nr:MULTISPECIES: hypothetical protein [Spirosoma]MCK8495746.1 hypothetical protein [Spirosoma liriopis]UHG94832.1 hypothetical protein LQ777_29750 [Spirosoma oryzicola]
MDRTDEPLFSSLYGQVTYCRYSDEFRVNFGEMQIWLSQEYLRQFARRVSQFVTVHESLHQFPLSHQFDICSPGCDGEIYRFYPDEILDLDTLLSGSLVAVDLYSFFDTNDFLVASV